MPERSLELVQHYYLPKELLSNVCVLLKWAVVLNIGLFQLILLYYL